MTATTTVKTNYEIFIDTVNSLKHSQGFYSRIAAQLDEMSNEQKEQIETEFNNLPQWNDVVDCVMYLEG